MENKAKKAKAPKREKRGLPEDVREQLNAPMPAESIARHPTKKFLSTIKAIYIVERLNDVFGVGGWILATQIEKETPDYVLVSGYISIPEFDVITPKQYGGHKTTGTNTELADGYKSAVTDVQSKCASYLEVGIDVFKGKVKPSVNPQAAPQPKPEAKKPAPKKAPKAEALPEAVVKDIEEKAKTVETMDELTLLFGLYPEHAKNAEYKGIFNDLATPLMKDEN